MHNRFLLSQVDDPTDPGKVKVYGPGVEPGLKACQPTWFTVDSRQAGPGDLEVGITDSNHRQVAIALKDNKNATHNVEYTPVRAGMHFVTVKYDGRELPQSPIKVDVKSDLDLGKIRVKVSFLNSCSTKTYKSHRPNFYLN